METKQYLEHISGYYQVLLQSAALVFSDNPDFAREDKKQSLLIDIQNFKRKIDELETKIKNTQIG